ncbi:hypothetical protein PV325_002413 [Microctonus aethiopoides]|nr:hypothetical protein PV325_002413 [Microctonus aethiopoides]
MNEPPKDVSYCLICNNKTSSRNTIQIFDALLNDDTEKNLADTICGILDTEINEYNVHSRFEEIESRMSEIRREIFNNYKSTIEKVKTVFQIDEECNDHDYLDTGDSQCEIRDTFVTEESEDNEHYLMNTKDEPIEEHLDEYLQEEIHNEEAEQSELAEEYVDDPLEHRIDNIEQQTIRTDNKLDETKKHESKKMKLITKEELFDPIVEREDTIYYCLLCPDDDNKMAGDAKQIIAHVKNIHDTRLYICDICGIDFRKRNELSMHLDDHVAREEGDFQCEVCNRIFSNLRLFRIHKRIHYPQIKSWPCEICGKRYSSKNLLDEHVNTHNGVRPYICQTCGKDFASKYTYKAHAKTHEVRPRPFECLQCNKTFLSQQNLNQHERTHLGVKEYVCHQCGKAFGSPHNLEVHNIVHTGYKPYKCRMCGKAFARKAEIRDHERTHTGEKPYQCELCGATFSQRSNLQSHKRATHYDDKRYKCDDCGKGFKRRRLLDYHIKAAHTGERPYKCETCTATFVYPEHFKKHMRIHTGEKPYLCEVCGKAFNSRDNRNAHRFIHSDKKPYECLDCGMGFMRKPLLYAHMQTQGHLNDTIVVNQPRLTKDEEVLTIPDGNIQLMMADDETEPLGDTQLYVTELKDHMIIQQDDEHVYQDESVLDIPTEGNIDEQVEHMVVGNQMAFSGGEVIECKPNNEENEDAFNYANGEDETIVLPANAEYKDIIGDSKNQVRLVQIRIPSSTGADAKGWLSLVQQHT